MSDGLFMFDVLTGQASFGSPEKESLWGRIKDEILKPIAFFIFVLFCILIALSILMIPGILIGKYLL